MFNPEWHPHARYHAAQLVFFGVVISLGGLWLLWRRSLEPRVAVWVVAMYLVCLWGGEFFAFAVPGTSASPDIAEPNTFPLLGLEVHGNLLFSGVLIVAGLLGAVLASSPAAARLTAQHPPRDTIASR